MSAFETQTVKGYELKEALGKGGFGAVYRAYQPLVKREVAIKVILPAFASRPEFIRRFETEAQLVAQLEHLHIVPLYDYWRDPSGAYLVMRYLRGGNLEQSLRKDGAWTLEDAARLLDQIASALAIAHQSGIVHSDLKPANILLDHEKNAYLSDFGIANNAREGGQPIEENVGSGGTPAYISPEQLQNQGVTPQTDIYSLGLVMFEVLTGKRAFQAQSLYGYIAHHLTRDLPDLHEHNPDLPAGLNEVLRVATAKTPQSRYPDTMAFARAFRQAIEAPPEVVIDDLDDLIVIDSGIGSLTITEDLIEMEAHNLALVNPYKGLRAFQQGDAKDFFGREALTRQLLGRLNEREGTYRFLAVVGPSGSGKSSVIKAGVLPALRRGEVEGSEHFYLAEMVPSTDAMRELEAALLSIAAHPPENMHDRLRNSPEGLHELLGEILPADGSELLLLIDQFEEVFTQTSDNAVRMHFMESIRRAVTAPDSRLRAIITLRADFYDKPLLYPDFGALVCERTEIILPMNERELTRAITGPAERVGVRVEEELVRRMVEDVSNEPGALPLLQYALTENFERRTGYLMTLKSYLDAGGVLGALARRAEELYTQMNDDQREAVRQLFLRLVTLGEGAEDTRRRVLWSELVFRGEGEDPLQYVLDTYGKYRLLTFDTDPQTREPTVEVAHEALIRNWDRLRGWLRDSREDLRVQRRLASAVLEWRNANHDPSFLASGVRLQQFELLTQSKDIALTADELEYVSASVAKREAQRLEEEARLAREAMLERRARRVLRALVAVFAIAAVVGLALAAFAFSEQREAAAQRDRAEQEAERAERKANETLSLNLSQQAEQNPRDGDLPFAGLALAMEANRLPDPPAPSQVTLANLVWSPGAIRRYDAHPTIVFDSVMSTDGHFLLTSDVEGRLILWDAATSQIVRRFGDDGVGHGDVIFSVALGPDGQTAVSGSQKRAMLLWDVNTGESIRRLSDGRDGHLDAIWAVAYLPDGRSIIASSNDAAPDRNLIQWDIETGEVIKRFEGHEGAVYALAISPDGRMLASASVDTTIILWDVASGEILRRLEGHEGPVFGVAFSPDGSRLVSGGGDNAMIVWDVETGDPVERIDGLPNLVRGVDYAPDGNSFAAALNDASVMVWDANTLALLDTFLGHTQPVKGVAYAPDGASLVSFGDDAQVIRWDVYGRGAELQRMNGGSPINQVDYDGTQALAATEDGLTLWDLVEGEPVRRLLEGDTVYAAAVHGDRGLSGGRDGTVTLWDLATGEALMTFEGHHAPVRTVAFSPDGTRVLSSGGNVQISADRPIDNDILVWDAATGELIARLAGHNRPVRSAVFSPDGTRILSGADDGTVILWDLATGDQFRVFPMDDPETEAIEGHSNSVTSVGFSPDGALALSGARDNTAIVWNAANGQIVLRLLGHESPVHSVSYSPDSATILTSSDAGTLILWDASTGEPIRRFRGHSSAVRSVVFGAGGATALSGSEDGHLILWRIDTLEQLLNWVYANYQVDCVPPEVGFAADFGANPRCQSITVETETGAPAPLLVPEQAAVATSGASCTISTPAQFLIPSGLVDTSAYEREAPFTVGYSQASADARSLYTAAWAQYEASLHEDIEAFTVADAGGDYQQQVDDVSAFIEQGVDLIILDPIEQTDMSAMQAALRSAREAGIPVVLVNGRVESIDYTTFVGVDQYKVGCIMAQELIAAMDAEGSHLRLTGIDATTSDNARKNGAFDLILRYPAVTLVDEIATNLDPEQAAQVTLGAISRSPRVDGLLTYNGAIAAAALETLADAGRQFVPVVSDQDVRLSRLIVENDLNGAQVRIPTSMGADAVRTALQILSGRSVPAFVEIPVEVITPTADDLDGGALVGDLEGLPEAFRPAEP